VDLVQNSDIKKPSKTGQDKEGIQSLNDKLFRYGGFKTRSVSMANYITGELSGNLKPTDNPLSVRKYKNALARLSHCGDWLVYNHYFTIDQLRLASADFCEKHLICPLCAARRGSKAIRVYEPKVQQLLDENPRLKAYMVTYTIKNGADLDERWKHITKGIKLLINRRRAHLSNPKKNPYTEFCKAQGGVYSFEVKRGQDSGEWHPHVHMIWLCESKPNQQKLRDEWEQITVDSFNVDVTPMTTGDQRLKGFLEVFKYALKFSEMPLKDNWEAYRYLNGKRLVSPFGSLYGLKIPDNLADDLIEDLPYLQMFYNYQNGGYNLHNTARKTGMEDKQENPHHQGR
jgi:hypothetical protein